MKALLVTMPDGTVWGVPVAVVALNRAEHYAKEYSGTYEERVQKALTIDVLPLDNYEIEDWAANNMNWDDVARHAVQVSGTPAVDYQEGWVNGAKEVRDINS